MDSVQSASASKGMPHASLRRVFFAFEVPAVWNESNRNTLESIRLRLTEAGVRFRWLTESDRHVTVVFLGDIDEGRIPELEEQGAAAAKSWRPFNVSFEQFRLLPTSESPTVLAAIFDGAIADDLTAGFRRHLMGAHAHKTLLPHVTVCRFSGKQKIHDVWALQTCEPVSFTKLTLFESVLQPGGSRYIALNQWNLGE